LLACRQDVSELFRQEQVPGGLLDDLQVEEISRMIGDEVLVARLVEPVKKDGRYSLSDGCFDDRFPGMMREGRELFLVKPAFYDKGHKKWMH